MPWSLSSKLTKGFTGTREALPGKVDDRDNEKSHLLYPKLAFTGEARLPSESDICREKKLS